MMHKKILLSSLVLAITACSSTPKQPDWLDNPTANYEASQYLAATGSASTRDTAADRARANLARIFEVAVQDSAMDFSQATVLSSAGQREVSNQQMAGRYVTSFADQILKGAEVVEYWKDEAGTHHSLAVLNKKPAAERFSAQIRELDTQASNAASYAKNTATNPVAALTTLEAARLGQLERASLNSNLVTVAGKGVAAKYSAEVLDKNIRDLLATLSVSASSDHQDLRVAMEKGLSAMGVKAKPGSRYQLVGVMDVEPIQQQQRWYWLRGSLELSFKEGETVLAKMRWPLKVSAQNEGMVMQRAKDQLANKMASYVYQLLTTQSEDK